LYENGKYPFVFSEEELDVDKFVCVCVCVCMCVSKKNAVSANGI